VLEDLVKILSYRMRERLVRDVEKSTPPKKLNYGYLMKYVQEKNVLLSTMVGCTLVTKKKVGATTLKAHEVRSNVLETKPWETEMVGIM
jgi:hypothetical protein